MRVTCLLIALVLPTLLAQKVVVHLVSHTHDDTGWLKTVDQYHYGSNNSIQFAGTQYILDSVVANLKKDPRRKFVYVEQAFFWRWWEEQAEDVRNDTKKLVAEGRLQFANGGWCMHDEAATYYIDMIDQTALGHRFLKNELNAVPYIGWQIDPFGHSATQAALLSFGSGFLATYFGRADFQEYNYREKRKEREFWWQASQSMSYATLLGGILLTNHYGPPSHFHWDVISPNKTPIETDPRLHGYNVPDRVQHFVSQALSDANKTLGVNVMWTMGDDFNYQDANMWFKNIDKLIAAVNADGRVEARYSTPLDYTLAKLGENVSFPLKTDDFFPYEDNPHAFWTGYYTSRAAFKRFVRDMSGFYTMARQVCALTGSANDVMLPAMGQAMGLAQHHDAVTGTSKQHVVFDYAERLSKARAELEATVGTAFQSINGVAEPFVTCYLSNETVCNATSGSLTATGAELSVLVWNQLAHEDAQTIRIPVPSNDIVVLAESPVDAQIYPAPVAVNNYGFNAESLPYILSFQILVPPLGFRVVKLKKSGNGTASDTSKPTIVSNGIMQLNFGSDGRLSSATDQLSGLTVSLTQEWCYYESNTGDNLSWQPSGAYIFRPIQNTTCQPLSNGTIQSVVIAHGHSETVVEQRFTDWQRIRLPNGARYFEVEFTIGPIPIGDGVGKEIVSRFSTNISSTATLYTDSNGREMQRRVKNQRSFPFQQTEPIAGNYYPVNAMAFINDSNAQLSVLVDSTNGGASLEDGSLELMVFRRILHDDGRGVGEPLNETEFITSYYECGNNCGNHYGPGLIIRGVHTVTVLPSAIATGFSRQLMDKVYATPRPFFTKASLLPSFSLQFLNQSLPFPIQLTTLELLNETTLLLRLSHQVGSSEDRELAKPVTVNIQSLFASSAFAVNSFEEYNLSANQKLSQMLRPMPSSRTEPNGWDVELKPMEVRTYLVDVSLA